MRWLVIALPLLAGPAFSQSVETPNATASVDLSTCTTANAHTTLDDDPDSPGGDWCNASADNSAHAIVNNYTDPSITLDNATDAQEIALYVKASNPGGTSPQVSLNIYDGANCADLHESGTLQTVTSESGQLLTQSWTSAGISGSADVCVQILCSAVGGSPAIRNSCDYDAVEWRAAEAAGASRRRLHVID
jgi:hypothetical protein